MAELVDESTKYFEITNRAWASGGIGIRARLKI